MAATSGTDAATAAAVAAAAAAATLIASGSRVVDLATTAAAAADAAAIVAACDMSAGLSGNVEIPRGSRKGAGVCPLDGSWPSSAVLYRPPFW